MPVSGTFLADFAAFYDACQKAEVSLRSFEAGSAKVTTSLNKMVDNFSGRKIIQDATLMAEAIERGGGTSKLTATELARVGAAANEAAAKFRALGIEVPPKIMALSDSVNNLQNASARTAPRITDLAGSLTRFDGALAALGLSIGPQVRGLTELSEASGKTASQLGGLATAGLVVAAGVGGWKLGRVAAEFLGTDKIIGDATAKLLGWGDVAGQSAGANADILARASKTAGREIKSMAEALDINAAASKKMQEATQKAQHDVEALAAAAARSSTILKHNADILWDTGAALEAAQFKRAAEAASAAAAKELQAIQALADAAKDWQSVTERIGFATLNLQERIDSIDGSIVPWAEHLLESGAAAQDVAAFYGLTDDQVRALEEDLTKAAPAATAFGAALVEAAKHASDAVHTLAGEWIEAAEAQKRFAAGGSFEVTRENVGEAAKGQGAGAGLEGLLTKGYSFEQAVLWSKHPEWAPPENPGPRVPGFAAGVENFSGGPAWVGERGPELLTLPRGSNITPNGALGGGGSQTTVVIQSGALVINNPSMRDRQSVNDLVDLVSNGIVAKLKGQGWRPSLALRH